MKKLLFVLLFLISCNGYDYTDQETSESFDKVCIEGHVYYRKSGAYCTEHFIKLDDNGKPIECGKQEKIK